MLILSRKNGQTITIGKAAGITITILGVRGGQVKIGINASRDIPVHRLEVYEQIQENKFQNNKKSGKGKEHKK